MLLRARVTLLRHERELAEIKALTSKLGHDDQKILKELQSVKARGKGVAGRDADAASTGVIQLLGKIGSALRAEGGASAPRPKGTDDASLRAAGTRMASGKRSSTPASNTGNKHQAKGARSSASSPSKRATRRQQASAGSRRRAKRKSATPTARAGGGKQRGKASDASSSRKRPKRDAIRRSPKRGGAVRAKPRTSERRPGSEQAGGSGG